MNPPRGVGIDGLWNVMKTRVGRAITAFPMLRLYTREACYYFSMSETTPIDLKGKKILIIEDDPLLHNLLSDKMKQLRDKGVEVFPTMNAEEGLKQAQESKPDLIMLDLVLPTMNGFEFLEKLRKEPGLEKTPVIILSNLSGDSDKERAKALGVIAYLVKADFSLSEISGAVEEILQGHAMPASKNVEPGVKKTLWGYMVYL